MVLSISNLAVATSVLIFLLRNNIQKHSFWDSKQSNDKYSLWENLIKWWKRTIHRVWILKFTAAKKANAEMDNSLSQLANANIKNKSSATWISANGSLLINTFSVEKCNVKPSLLSLEFDCERAMNCHTKCIYKFSTVYMLKTTSDWAHKTCNQNDKM